MNQLQYEKSPYLRQHQNNPVLWQAWGESAFEQARRENKPIFLSIGYSTCHWCHVMARECFEDAPIAEVLNKNYVPVKVDREEHPDVDALYMAALVALTGGGGWPLSAWLAPDGRPFFAGTYFPPTQFLSLLTRIEQLWKSDHARILEDAETFASALRSNLVGRPDSQAAPVSKQLLTNFARQFGEHFDDRVGGSLGAPKFPQTMSLLSLIRADLLGEAPEARGMVSRTLEGMTEGGLQDHVEGGFHRYCVDASWTTPHYEKMLYDQAWIALALFEGAAYLKDPKFVQAGEATLRFVREQLEHPAGGFYAALDAESVDPATGVKSEGFYYLAKDRTGLPKPHRDEKIIASWNGWMISAFCKGYEATQNKEWREAALSAWRFIKQNLWKDGAVSRRWCEGDTSIRGTSEDYASLIMAALSLYQIMPEKEFLDDALRLQTEMNDRFWSAENHVFYFSDGQDKNLLFRFGQESEGVTPTTLSMTASNLARLAFLTGDKALKKQTDEVLRVGANAFAAQPLRYPYFGVAVADVLEMESGGGPFICTADRCSLPLSHRGR